MGACPLCVMGHDDSCPLCHGTGRTINNFFLESNERYTPRFIIELARTTMDGITLDPASSELANKVVKALHIWTRQDDGLRQSWWGNVFCNPPFSRIAQRGKTFQELFIKKGIEEFTLGNVKQIVFLLHGLAMYNEYFDPLFDYPICIIRKTIYFRSPTGGDAHDGRGNVAVYLGDNDGEFVRQFSTIGSVLVRVRA